MTEIRGLIHSLIKENFKRSRHLSKGLHSFQQFYHLVALTMLLQNNYVTLLFSYVRDATAAMFIAFSLFVFPSKRPRIFAPDGSGKFTI